MIAQHISIIVIVTMMLGLLAPAAAHAQTDPQRTLTATALYEEALKEMHAAHYENACRKLEEVTRLAPEGLGAKLTLGKCYEALGKLASAWSQYAVVAAMAPKMGQPERAEKAAQKAAELKPRLAMLTVQVPAAVASIAGLSIMRDGVPVGEAQWGMPLPVDAGRHDMVVKAPGRKTWTQDVEVKGMW